MIRRLAIAALIFGLAPAGASAQDPEFLGKKKSEWLKLAKEGPTPRSREAAIAALALMDNKDRAIYDALGDALLNDKAERVRLRAIDATTAVLKESKTEPNLLDNFGKAISTDKSDEVRLKGLNFVKELKKDDLGKLAPVLIEVLKSDKVPANRSAAAVALSRTGEKAKTVLTAIADCLKDPDANVRASVAESLGRLGEDGKGAIPKLIPVLKDADAGARLAAAFALGRVGPEAAVAAPELANVLATDADPAVRKEAARAFALLGLDGKAGVAALGKALREDKVDEVRQQAALALGKMRYELGSVLPLMLEAIQKDPNKTVRAFTVHALADALGSTLKDYVKELADLLLKETEGEVRLAIVQELGALGPDAKAALPALNRMVADVQVTVRDEAKRAVKRVMGQ